MPDRQGDSEQRRQVRVWDLPVRVFHWVLVLLFVVCFASGTQGRLDIHIPAGQALLILVLARVIWGFVGSETSRLKKLLNSPPEILAYIRSLPDRSPGRWVGHNPLGALSVLAMLTLLVLQAGLGLFAADVDGLYEGPLSFLVAYETARRIAGLHVMAADILLILVGLHIAAVLFYVLYKRDNIVRPMITGRAAFPSVVSEPRTASVGRAIAVLIVSAGIVLGGVELANAVF